MPKITKKSRDKRYQKTLNYLYGLVKFNPRYSTEPTKKLLALLDYPQNSFKTIVVAGTNGKGSVCAMLENILRKSGYRTGLFISPHLEKFNERVQVSSSGALKPISNKDIVRLTLKLKPFIKKLRRSGCDISFHEALVPLAFLYFKEKKINLSVLEVGMGGRLDAVNVTEPILSIITNIQYDHMEILGDTLTKIAREKIGIVPQGGVLVTGAIGEGLKEIKRISKKNKIRLQVIQSYKNAKINSSFQKNNQKILQSFTYKNYKKLNLSLLGPHQFKNACVVIEAVTALRKQGVKINDSDLRSGLKSAIWSGRFEIMDISYPVLMAKKIVKRKRMIIFDCAHNPDGMQALAKTLKFFDLKNLICVFGASYSLITKKPNPERIRKMLKFILPFSKKIIFTQAKYRGVNLELLEKIFKKINPKSKNADQFASPKKAFIHALEISSKNDIILVCGSIYLVGEVRKGCFKDLS